MSETMTLPTIPNIAGLDLKQAALAYVEAGLYIGPLASGSKSPGSLFGKGWPDQTSNDPAEVERWFSSYSVGGIFLHCGKSGIVVLDADHARSLPEDLTAAMKEQPPLVQFTRENRQRFHCVYAATGVGNTGGGYGSAWGDVRGANGIIVLAPTPHVEDGGLYSWGSWGPVPELPAAIAAELGRGRKPRAVRERAAVVAWEGMTASQRLSGQNYAAKVVSAELRRLDALPRPWVEGAGWDMTLFEVSCNLAEIANAPWNDVDINVVEAQFMNRAPADDVWDSRAEKWQRGVDKTEGAGRDIPWSVEAARDVVRREMNDVGNGLRFADRFSGLIGWVWDGRNGGSWVRYSDERGVWEAVGPEVAGRAYIEMLGRLRDDEAVLWPEGEVRESWLKWLAGQFSDAKIKSGLSCAKTSTELGMKMEDFDTHTDLLNVSNGVLNVTTGELVAHSASYRFLEQAPVEWTGVDHCPSWDRMLSRQIPAQDVREWVEIMLAYAALTDGNARKLFIIIKGPKDTGKTKLLQTIKQMLGSYAGSINMSTFKTKKDADAARPDLVKIHNKRFVIAAEASSKSDLDGEHIKQMTGEDDNPARDLFSNKFTAGVPHYTPVLGTNETPSVVNADDAVHERLRAVLFGSTVPIGERDRELDTKLKAEWSGILARLVKRLERVVELDTIPAQIRNWSDEVFGDMSPLSAFLTDVSVEGDGIYPVDEVYALYRRWAADGDLGEVVAAHVFGKEMTQLGWPSKQAKVGGIKKRVRFGRLLRTDAESSGGHVVELHRASDGSATAGVVAEAVGSVGATDGVGGSDCIPDLEALLGL